MISIIIPIHNQADKVGACLDSIIAQTEKNWEIILIDDGSTDDIKTIVEKYSHLIDPEKFKFFSKSNEGSNPTRNFGFAHSSGDYILFCDADVIMQAPMLEKMKVTLEKNPQTSFAFSSFKYGAKLFRLFPYDEKRLRSMPYIHTTSLIRRSDFPGFDPAIKRLQDWDLWLTMLEAGKTGIWIDEVLYMTQLGNGHISNWLPSFIYKLMPFLPSVKKYNQAVEIIKTKHHLS